MSAETGPGGVMAQPFRPLGGRRLFPGVPKRLVSSPVGLALRRQVFEGRPEAKCIIHAALEIGEGIACRPIDSRAWTNARQFEAVDPAFGSRSHRLTHDVQCLNRAKRDYRIRRGFAVEQMPHPPQRRFHSTILAVCQPRVSRIDASVTREASPRLSRSIRYCRSTTAPWCGAEAARFDRPGRSMLRPLRERSPLSPPHKHRTGPGNALPWCAPAMRGGGDSR